MDAQQQHLRLGMAGAIVLTDDSAALMKLRSPGVLAVVVESAARPAWQEELVVAVERGAFVIDRCTLTLDRSEALPYVLEQRLPHSGLSFETRLALIDDLANLADSLTLVSGCRGILLRIFTESPSQYCGFHVDTVMPGCPPFGLLKVYNGQGTRYVNPADVKSMRDFYAYAGRRERLRRELKTAIAADDAHESERLQRVIYALDHSLPFLKQGASVQELRAGSTVGFRHLDIRDHWAEHGPDRAWIHCSPIAGAIRLVVNLTPLDGAGVLQHESSARRHA
jgi:hypothetical protein